MYTKKLNGSFIIEINGMPYNTIKGDKYYENTLKLYNSNPELFEIEKEYIKPLEELKEEKTKELKKITNDIIIKKYPYYKQLNIIRDGNEEEKKAMSFFINEKIEKTNIIEKKINNCKTKKELEEIIINIDE